VSNFSFIPSHWANIAETPKEAEMHVVSAPMYSAMLCRKSLEEWVRWMYEHDEDLTLPYDTSLNSLLHTQAFKDIIAPSFYDALNAIRRLGNDAVHTSKKIPPVQAMHTLQLLHNFIAWVVNVYGEERVVKPVFDESLIPSSREAEKTKDELQQLDERYHEQQDKLVKLEAELAEIKANKLKNITQVPPPLDPNEALTRKMYIDVLLRESGWNLELQRVIEYPVKNCMPTAESPTGNGYVDYVLWGDDGKPLALVEAKKTRRDARVGQHQAKCYADCLEKEFGQRPVIYYSNGYEHWMWDDSNYPPRRVYGFYTKDELQALVLRRSSRKSLQNEVINNAITDRYYQHEAIRAVSETLERNNREALLVMATGTGKTRVSASIIDLLSKANWVKRVLFLADRNALVYQAKTNLNDYLPNLPSVDLTREKEDESSRIVFSTYQTMINMIDGEVGKQGKRYGVGHFDLIIFDEIHRSVYNRYKHIFKYFDGIRLGLTATPRHEGDRDTYHLFNLEQHIPTYAYELDQAVSKSDRYLVPPRALSVPLKFHREGIKYADLNEEEKLKYEEQFVDPITGEFPDEIESSALNSWLFNTNTVDQALSYLMTEGIHVEGGDKLAKTIIFARSQAHAKFIEERFDLQYPEYKGEFLKVITNNEEYRYDILNHFKDKIRMPQIAVSVDMLDTGIDVPEVCNLVFFKPVKSRTKFWQMVGRGTRLCKDLFGVGDDKKEFVIFDFCENLEFFSLNPQGFESSAGKAISHKLFEIRLLLARALVKNDNEEYASYGQSLLSMLIRQTQALNTASFIVRQHLAVVEKYRDPNQWNALSDLEIKELIDVVGPLVNETDQDEMAKRFDLMMLEFQAANLNNDPSQKRVISRIKMTSERLSKKASIPMIAEKMDLIKAIQKESYWEEAGVLDIEKVRIELRGLMRFLDKNQQVFVTSDFKDELFSIKEIKIINQSQNLQEYRNRVEHFIRENKHHLTINKLQNNLPITAEELQELERLILMQNEGITEDDLLKAMDGKSLGLFIRSIIGLDVNAAKLAFGEFLNNQQLNSTQIRFINKIIDKFTVSGIVDPGMLFEPPFTDLNSGGVLGLFDEKTSTKIVSLIEGINQNTG
jgi:type I restriction enzyme, R subunit